MKNINKSVRSVSNGSRKVFCEIVKRANLFKATPHNSRLTAQTPLWRLRHGICVAKMLDNVGLRYPHRASGAKAPRTLRPLPLLRFAVSATGGAHLCSIQYYLRFWPSICRTSLAVSALRMMRYCLENPGSQAGDRPFPTDALARHNKIIGCSAIIKVLTPKPFVQERLKNPP